MSQNLPQTVSKLSQGCLKVTNAVTKVILKFSHIDMGYGKGGYGGWPGILRLKLSNGTVCLYISNVVIEDWCELKNWPMGAGSLIGRYGYKELLQS